MEEECDETEGGFDTLSEKLDRRSYLKLAGVAAGSASLFSAESDVARAATAGYGANGFGSGPYGGSSGFSVGTQSPTDVQSTSTTLNGELVDLDGAESAICYFEWRRIGASSWNTTSTQTLSTAETYSASVSGLDEGVEYEFRAVGDASDGEANTGETVTLTTGSDPPAVTAGSASDVTATSATLGGSLDDLGGASSVDCHFEWREVGASSWTATAEQTLSTTGSFSASVSGLDDGVEYEYKPVTTGSDGDTDEGSVVTFTTVNASPAVTSEAASNVTDASATLNGSLDDLGGASSVDCHFEWREVGTSSWTATAGQTLSTTGSFSADVSGASGGTDYEHRAVAQASDGDADTGGTVQFSTESSDTAPTVDSYTVTEAGSPNPHAEITADWSGSDADGDLNLVTVDVIDASGSVVDSARTDVSGANASGTNTFQIKKVSGESFDVTLTITDAAGNGTSATRTVTE